MKKILNSILSFIILACVLCSCNQLGEDSINGVGFDGGADNGFVLLESPPDQYSYGFDSYQELYEALTQKKSNEFSKLREEQANYGNVYQKTLSDFESNDVQFAIPEFDGVRMELRNKEGYDNITFMTCELYNLPWCWYHGVVDSYSLDVKIAYLDVIEKLDYNSTTTYVEILRLIAPDAPSPENYEKFDSYTDIYEKELVLNNDDIVVAMISELKDSTKVYVMFQHNGMLISLYGNNELFTEKFFKSFDIVRQ